MILRDKYGESLGGSQAPPGFWKVPGSSPSFRESFSVTFPEALSVELNSNPGVPRKFPRLPRKFPRSFPDFPRGQPLSLGSLTPSPDSRKLSLRSFTKSQETRCVLHEEDHQAFKEGALQRPQRQEIYGQEETHQDRSLLEIVQEQRSAAQLLPLLRTLMQVPRAR